MNKYLICLILFLTFILQSCTTDADDDSDNWDAAKVCPETGNNSYGMPNRGTFVDERDGQVYKYTTIGNQVWMAENLRYDAENSECYDVFKNSCETFGRLYSIAEGEKLVSNIDTSVANHICPEGWHLPEKEEWEVLFENMGGVGNENTIKRMKSAEYWGVGRGAGYGECELNILPAGGVGTVGRNDLLFRTALFVVVDLDSKIGYSSYGFEKNIHAERNLLKESVRCVKD